MNEFAFRCILALKVIVQACMKTISLLNYIYFSIDGNKPPQAYAGPDVFVKLPNRAAALDGSKSSDDYGIVSYKWSRDLKSPAAGVGFLEACLNCTAIFCCHFLLSAVIFVTRNCHFSASIPKWKKTLLFYHSYTIDFSFQNGRKTQKRETIFAK